MNRFIKRLLSLLIVTFFFFGISLSGDFAYARGSKKGSGKSYSSSYKSGGHRGRPKASGVARNKQGKITRSSKAKQDFKKNNPCPSTGKHSGSCPGYVIDHVVPLKRGGADAPHNMQWQTKEEAKLKDKTE